MSSNIIKNINDDILDLAIKLPVAIFGGFEWDEDELDDLVDQINFIETNFYEEIETNLLGKNYIEKQDIIIEYVVPICQIYSYVIRKYCKQQTPSNLKAQQKIKKLYTHIMDVISEITIK